MDETHTATPPELPVLLEYSDLAAYAGVAERTARKWVAEGKGPRAVRLGGRRVRFRVEDVTAWVEQLAESA